MRKRTGYKSGLGCLGVGAVSVWEPTKAVQNKWSEGPRYESIRAGLATTVDLAAY